MTTKTIYESTVEYTVGDEARVLSMTFEGSPSDYYWNYATARDFYAERIKREGGTVTAYGTHGPVRIETAA